MPSTYIPSRESALDNWLGNFAAKISAAPTVYGLTDADAVAIAGAVGAFHSAFLVATAPISRTAPAVNAKNEAKTAALAVARRYAAIIRADDGVSRELKITLGLHVPAVSPEGTPVAGSAIPAPQTWPNLTVTNISSGGHRIRIADSGPTGRGHASGRSAKPRTAMGLVLFRAIADAPVSRPDDARFLAIVTRADCRSEFTRADNGKTATYFARWANLKGELGPWSSAASMPIAA